MSEIKLKKGDKVVMHTCLESKGKNLGKVWTCCTDSFKCEAGIEVVFLEGFSGFFYTKFLQPVKLEATNKKISDECHKLVNSLEKKQNENIELIGKVAFLENDLNNAKAQIEKMKCCENCKHHYWAGGADLCCRLRENECKDKIKLEKWEFES